MILLSTVSDFHELAGAHAQYTSPQKPLHSSLIRPSGLIRLDTLQSVQLPAAGSRTLAPGHAPHHHHQLGCANGEADSLLAPSCTGTGSVAGELVTFSISSYTAVVRSRSIE